jgi:acyl dehydratase
MKALYFEEIELGTKELLGSHHFSREAILRFAHAYDPQPFHLDDDAAAKSHFGALCASGWHTAAGWMKCYVDFNDRHRRERAKRGEKVPTIGPSPGFENLKWLKPVYAGDTITYFSSMSSKRPLRSRAGWGLLGSANIGINQKGEEVFSFDGKVLVQRLGQD